ncbi:hypothetical protein BGZ73_002009 [Actinomortierella ambigua]|nr:hypothetical protein BGZ73_002009 [Actinomortierella ambigua]
MERAGDKIKKNLRSARGKARRAFGKAFHRESRDIQYFADEAQACVKDHLPDLEDFYFDPPDDWNYWNTADEGDYGRWSGDVRMLLQNLPESIQTVSLNNVRHVPLDTNMVSNLLSEHDIARVRRHHGLKSLSVDGQFEDCEAEVLVPFLESRSANLQSVAGLHSAFLTHPEIAHTLEKIGFAWKEFDRHDLPDNVAAKAITHSSQWTRIDLRTTSNGPLAAAAIVGNCANLEKLVLINGTHVALGFTGSHLQMVLAKAPRLKSLVFHWSIHDNMITASDILSSEWATTSLEHIDFKISRHVLRRLGQQKNLRKLLIGGPTTSSQTENFGCQLNCLEMTLDSGLDELAGLKDLDELDINRWTIMLASQNSNGWPKTFLSFSD